jgi:hypothetical protein
VNSVSGAGLRLAMEIGWICRATDTASSGLQAARVCEDCGSHCIVLWAKHEKVEDGISPPEMAVMPLRCIEV